MKYVSHTSHLAVPPLFPPLHTLIFFSQLSIYHIFSPPAPLPTLPGSVRPLLSGGDACAAGTQRQREDPPAGHFCLGRKSEGTAHDRKHMPVRQGHGHGAEQIGCGHMEVRCGHTAAGVLRGAVQAAEGEGGHREGRGRGKGRGWPRNG